MVLSVSGLAQNTKGDRPASSRENRFKTAPRKETAKKSSSKRISPGSAGGSYRPRGRARGGERAGRPLRPVFNVNKPKDTQRAWKGDLTGRPIRHKDASSVKPYVHRQSGPHVRRSVPSREGRQNVSRGRPPRVESATGKIRNIYPQRGPYVNNPSPVPRDPQRSVSNRGALARLKALQSDGKSLPPGKKVKVVPRSASRAFIRHKSINVYATFPRPKKKPERAITTDLAGRKLRAKNFQTPRPGLIPAPDTYRGRRPTGKDRPYTGPSGSYKSATRGGSAWLGDIAGRAIRHRDRTSKRSVEGIPVLSRKPRSATRTGKKGDFLPSLKPGIGGRGVERGLQVRGKKRSPVNISGIPVRSKGPRIFGDQGEGFAGTLKSKRPLKGGGSVSGRLWNNDGRALPPRIPRNGADISGITVRRRPMRGFSPQGEEYTGNIKARKPLKGGGSVSGKLWNNNETPIAVRQPRQGERALGFSGNIKAKDRGPSVHARKAAEFKGRNKLFELTPGFSDQGEEYTGAKKVRTIIKRSYIQNKLAHEESIRKQRPQKEAYGINGLQVKVKRRDYVRNKDVSEDALKKLKQTKTDQAVAGLQVKVKRRGYVKNPNATEEALLKLKPTKADREVAELQVRVKQYHYIRNPSSVKEALRVREPGKAFARATDYQGNIKMQKYRLFERNRDLHPDAKFVKTNKNNVREERDSMTNLKLWWARLFKKQDTQPDHLKEKGKKPRYDKGEQGLWYD